MGLSQQTTAPCPPFVQRTSVAQTEHLNLLPNWFIKLSPYYYLKSVNLTALFFKFHGLTTAAYSAIAGLGHDKL
jgi:hypothetical protein